MLLSKKMIFLLCIFLAVAATGCISAGRMQDRGIGDVRGAYQHVLIDEPGSDPMRESVYFVPFKRYTF